MSVNTLPEPIQNKLNSLSELITKYPDYIPVDKAASIIGTDIDSLRTAIDQGKCPFGYAWKKDGGYRAFKIPTTTFYLWYTAGRIL